MLLEREGAVKPIVRVKNLTKRFGDLVALDSVSFDVSEGECFGLLGPNGAGKTTTIKMLYGLSTVTSGELFVADLPVPERLREIKRLLGVVPQENNLDPDLTVLENLLAYARYFDLPKQEAQRRAIELLQFVELDGRRDARIEELSAGMKRRLIIARALLHHPKILLLDEPTTGLDPQARHLIWQRLRKLKRGGITLILTTHYMEEAEQLSDRVAILDKGKILQMGSPRELVLKEVGSEVIELRLEEGEEPRIQELVEGDGLGWEKAGDTLYLYCRDGRAILHSLAKLPHLKLLHRPATLEDLFLRLTGRRLHE